MAPHQQFPTRHREAESRGTRLGRPLRLVSGLRGPVDEALLDRLGRALLEQDEAGAAVAAAMRRAPGDPERVTHAHLRAALSSGSGHSTPPTLRTFLDEVSTPPGWVDWDRVARGARVFDRLGRSAGDVLLQLSLIGGYRFGGPTELLVATGGLNGPHTLRRIAETQQWTLSLMRPGALRPGGEGWRTTLHVRVMHALVNSAYAGDPERWDVQRWGLPINQADQAGTLGLFDATLVVGCRALGIPVPRDDAEDLLHLWKYVGWLMGVHPDFLTDDEDERTWLNLHILYAAAGQTQAGRELAQAIVAAQMERRFAGDGAVARRLRGRYEQERLLSMLTMFLGPASMRELGLPIRPPWAFAGAVGANTWRHRVIGRSVRGRATNERRGLAVQQRLQATYVVEDAPHAPRVRSGSDGLTYR